MFVKRWYSIRQHANIVRMNDTLAISLPERLRITRKRAGKTQKQMARLLDLGPSTIANWEEGRLVPDYRSKVAWCFALGIPLSDLGVAKIVCSPSPDEIVA